MSEQIQEKVSYVRSLLSLVAGVLIAALMMVLALPLTLFGLKENRLMDKVSEGPLIPTVHASDQFSCGCCCCTTQSGGNISGCASGGTSGACGAGGGCASASGGK